MKDRKTIYFVEGQCEEVIVRSLIQDFHLLPPGRIKVLNISQRRFPQSLMFSLIPGTCIVFIFDTDTGTPHTVRENIVAIERMTTDVEVIVIPQCRNLEDELIYSCSLKEIRQITGSRSNKNFKHDLIHASNVHSLLKSCGFNFARLWSRKADMEWEILRQGEIKNSRKRK